MAIGIGGEQARLDAARAQRGQDDRRVDPIQCVAAALAPRSDSGSDVWDVWESRPPV